MEALIAKGANHVEMWALVTAEGQGSCDVGAEES